MQMEKITACILAYAVLIVFGVRYLRKEGRKREIFLFLGLIGWCVYMSAARIFALPSGSIGTLNYLIFAPAGKWVSYLLGDPSS